MPRSHSKAQVWADRLHRFQSSNITLAQFCRQENISACSFYYWRNRIQSDLPSASEAIPVASNAKPAGIASGIHFTIEAGSMKIQCHADSIQAIETLLSWVAKNRESSFHQVVLQR